MLGEPIDLTLVLKNTAAGAIELQAPSEKTGNVRLSIAEDANPTAFRSYNGPEWGTKDARRPPVRLKKNGSLRLNLHVLSNGVPRVAKPDPKELSTPFAFGAAGRFVARVRYEDRSNCPDQPVEATVTIQVAAPAGEELVVWDRIKTCAACALLLHTAELDPNDRASQDAVALFARSSRSTRARVTRNQSERFSARSTATVEATAGTMATRTTEARRRSADALAAAASVSSVSDS